MGTKSKDKYLVMSKEMQRSNFAIIIQPLERHAVRHAIDFMTKQGFTVGSIIHDGFFVEKKTGINEKPAILTDIGNYVEEKTGMKMNFGWEEFVSV